MSTTCKCVTTVKIFPTTYVVKTTRDIRFFTAFRDMIGIFTALQVHAFWAGKLSTADS